MTDATNRSWRSLLQGLVTAVVVAALEVGYRAITGVDDVMTLDWTQVGRAVGAAVVLAVVSYLHRTVLDPSRIPSAAPPV